MSLSRTKSLYFHQLASMYEAGLPLANALDVLGNQSKGGRLKRATRRIRRRIMEDGMDLSSAMREEPKIFSSFEVELIASGEMTGRLDVSLTAVAEWLELVAKWGKNLIGGLAYPIFLFHALAVVFNVVPFFQGQIEGPAFFIRLLTLVLPLYIFILFCAFVLPRARRNMAGVAYATDSLFMFIPVVRQVFVKLAFARFALSMRCMMEAGAPIVPALEASSLACGNQVIGRRLRKSIGRLEQGSSVTEALKKTRVMPMMALEFIRTGEETGKLDLMFGKLSTIFADDAEFAIQQAVQWIPRLAYLIMAGLIGYYIVTTFQGIYGGYDDLMGGDLPI